MAEVAEGLKEMLGLGGRRLRPVSQPVSSITEAPKVAPEVISPEEARLRLGTIALESALGQSGGTAIVNMGLSQIDQGEVAGRMEGFVVTRVIDILNGSFDQYIPVGSKGFVVTGYSSRFYDDEETEEIVQGVIRGVHSSEVTAGRGIQVLVLSDSMPNADFMSRGSPPWANGPFEKREKSVWTLVQGDADISLIQHGVSGSWKDDHLKWIELQSIQYDYDLLGKNVSVG